MKRFISDVPKDKLEQVVTDLGYEVGKENVKVTLQADNRWTVEYDTCPPNLAVQNSGSYASSSVTR